MTDFLGFSVVPGWEVALRALLAMTLGYIIGMDRHLKKKPTDFRAYMIICVSTCAVAIMGQEVYQDYIGADPVLEINLAHIINGALTGIGFLGAGSIIKQEDNNRVIGTATGASIWASGGIGLCLGFGYYGLASVLALSVVISLTVFGLATGRD